MAQLNSKYDFFAKETHTIAKKTRHEWKKFFLQSKRALKGNPQKSWSAKCTNVFWKWISIQEMKNEGHEVNEK